MVGRLVGLYELNERFQVQLLPFRQTSGGHQPVDHLDRVLVMHVVHDRLRGHQGNEFREGSGQARPHVFSSRPHGFTPSRCSS
jgi:hypothetical protein